MQPILISFGPLVIHSYGLMIAIAFLVGIIMAIHYAKKVGWPADLILDLAIWSIIGAIVGARLMYVVGQWSYYRGNLLDIFMVQKGGLAFLGGFLISLLLVTILGRRKKISLLRLFDVCAPSVSIGYAIARVGCFLNGCCFGKPTDFIFGLKFPFGSVAYSHFPHEAVHPTQLYALVFMLFVFLFIIYLWRRRKYDGQIFYTWLVLYGTYRFLVEFLRYCPPNLYVLGLNPGQWIALGLFVVGAIGLFKNRQKN
ncbi:MAG: prolipoprotein diacylglyceryl transferase [bacterium]